MKLKNILIAACGAMLSCAQPDCIDKSYDFIGVSFYNLDDGEVESIRINRLEIVGIDTIFTFEDESVSNLSLPINPAANEITAYFDTEYGNDTITIAYTPNSRLVEEDCGFEVTYNNLSVIKNDFDTAVVQNSTVQYNFLDPDAFNENIRIYN